MESEQTDLFKEVREALSKSEPQGIPTLQKETLLPVAHAIAAGGTEVDELLALAFPDGVSATVKFYDCIQLVQRRLGFSETASLLAGEIGARSIEKVEESERIKILECLLDSKNKDFFGSLQILPVFIERVVFPTEFLLRWFIQVHARICKDGVQGAYWRSLQIWALKHPSSALDGLRLLCSQSLDDDKISIGACLLGNLRVVWAKETPRSDGITFESSLAQHGDSQKRLIFHRSWINTGWQRGLTGIEFTEYLERISKEDGETRLEGFNFLRCLLPSQANDVKSLESGLEWLRSNVSSALPDNSKHWVVNIVKSLAERTPSDTSFLEKLWPLLVSVQPIQKQNVGTWRELEYLLVELLGKNSPQFHKLLLLLLDSNPEGLRHCFESHNSFQYLLSEMTTRAQRGFYADLFFSPIRYRREFAFTLFDELPFSDFPDGILVAKTDDEIALALLEFRLHHLQPDHIFLFLNSFLARVENSSKQLVNLFKGELLHESKNHSGAVLEKLKPKATTNELVCSVVKEAESYFDKLQKVQQTGINSMQVPGLFRAFSIHSRKQSREVETKTEELSILKYLCSNPSYLLYGGKQFRYCRDGELDGLSELKQFSTSIELPRLEIIDPEGSAIRRHHTLRDIRRLEITLTGMEVSNDT